MNDILCLQQLLLGFVAVISMVPAVSVAAAANNNHTEVCALGYIKPDSGLPNFVRNARIYVPYHGFLGSPKSRALLCREGQNRDCGPIRYEPQSVEGPKGFPARGPKDGSIAGAGRYHQLDEYGPNRWVKVDISSLIYKVNSSHVGIDINWVYTARHRTSGYHLYGTTVSYDENKEPLTRAKLAHLQSLPSRSGGTSDVLHHVFESSKLHRRGVLLSIWDIGDTSNAFYQVVDYVFNGNSDVPPPVDDGGDDSPITTTTQAPPSDGGNQPPVIPPNQKCYDETVLFETGYARSLCDCHSFYQLGAGNIPYLLMCPANLVFNPALSVCDWPNSVDVTGIPCSK